MAFQTELKPLLERAIESIGVILYLSTTFKTMQSDSIFDEILAMSNELSDPDMRAQFNYSLLLFSTGKVYHNYVTILTSRLSKSICHHRSSECMSKLLIDQNSVRITRS